jgi:lipoprotein-releasing system ATP-binding protein
LKDFTALENVMLPSFMGGEDKQTAIDRARDLLEQVRMADRLNHYPSQLSGGERQRVAVARSLINGPSIILADEPTGNLDEANSRIVEDLLFDLVKRYNTTLILVTHDTVLEDRADRFFRLEDGRLIEQ